MPFPDLLSLDAPIPSQMAVAERVRVATSHTRRRPDRRRYGQVFTPIGVGRFMASMFGNIAGDVRILDPGAGGGVLTAALCERINADSAKPDHVSFTCVEADSTFSPGLNEVLESCVFGLASFGVPATGSAIVGDFLELAANSLLQPANRNGAIPNEGFTHVIMNPPYAKVRSDSTHRQLMRKIGMETSNLYSAFMMAAVRLLNPDGELVAIVPRSFCNGFYFKSFRRQFLHQMRIARVHVIDARTSAFSDESVLQENVILHAVRSRPARSVLVTSTSRADFQVDPASGSTTAADLSQLAVDYGAVVLSGDDMRIALPTSATELKVIRALSASSVTLGDLGVDVSTGPVVRFRFDGLIGSRPRKLDTPLVGSESISAGARDWHVDSEPCRSMIDHPRSAKVSWSNDGWYVLTRRITSKEEPRRIVARVYGADHRFGGVAFENHVNVLHRSRAGLPRNLAMGICAYLNSTLVDILFRAVSGSTQVNAKDLEALPFPSEPELIRIGELALTTEFSLESVDTIVEEVLQLRDDTADPVAMNRKVEEATAALSDLGMPTAQINRRSALTLLALVNLRPAGSWQELEQPMLGITPIIEFGRENYGSEYAPNSREVFRKHTIHQFIEAGIAEANPDDPARATNSPRFVYRVTDLARRTLAAFRTPLWEDAVARFVRERAVLIEQIAARREAARVPVRISPDAVASLSPGPHSELIALAIEELAPRFFPDCDVVYIGDTGTKSGFLDRDKLRQLGIDADSAGKMPDVILHVPGRDWLVLIEAVTSHGPIDALRHRHLRETFATGRRATVFVTAFRTRRELSRHAGDLSWETEAWAADAPDHMVHFDGERFLGPFPAA